MPNRILKESILDSPTLARLDDFIQDQFPRLLLLVDDWGCFNADPESVKGKAYPKRKKVTVRTVETIIEAFWNEGMLFRWMEGDRIYGYWVSWDEHNYCTGSSVDEDGQRVKFRRKTPAPPQEQLGQYLAAHRNKSEQVGTFGNKSEQVGTKGSITIPITIPITNSLEEEEAVTPEAVMETYNRERGLMHECKRLTDERIHKCALRTSEHKGGGAAFLRDFTEAIIKARDSPFMIGKGARGWIADFDFFIKNSTNYIQVTEGKYDRIQQSEAQGKQQRTDDNARELLRLVDEQTGGGFPAGNQSANAGDVSSGPRRLTAGQT